MEYKVVKVPGVSPGVDGPNGLNEQVNDLIRLGWRPVGVVVVTEHGGLMQTMVRG